MIKSEFGKKKGKIINLDFLALIFPLFRARDTQKKKRKTNAKYVWRAMYPATSL